MTSLVKVSPQRKVPMINVLAPPKEREKAGGLSEKTPNRAWRHETSNGVFTILDFKPKHCSQCGRQMSPRGRSGRSVNSVILQCLVCTCRENGSIGGLVAKTRSPLYYDVDGEFQVEVAWDDWFVGKATVNLT